MPFTPNRYPGTLGTTTTTIIPAVSANTQIMAKGIRITNKTASDVTLNAVTIGTTTIIPQQTVAAGGFVTDDTLFVLVTGDTMTSSAGTANALDFYVSATVVS